MRLGDVEREREYHSYETCGGLELGELRSWKLALHLVRPPTQVFFIDIIDSVSMETENDLQCQLEGFAYILSAHPYHSGGSFLFMDRTKRIKWKQ